jgi:hypothetical protein
LFGRTPESLHSMHIRFILAAALIPAAVAQQQQNPSPMVEHTREHPRLEKSSPAGRREKLSTGTLFIPAHLQGRKRVPLFVHFHGGDWLPEVAAARDGHWAVISVQVGVGSSVYARQFSGGTMFGQILKEASEKTGVVFEPLALTAWSAGHGAIREILQVPEYYARVQSVLLIDGFHTGYVGGKPGPLESALDPDHLEVFLKFARDAVAGRKKMIVTHSEIFPGTFASTTETTDWLIAQLGLKRRAVLRWGPMKTQQLSEVRKGRFLLLGYAGNSAPDHVDQFHSLPEYLKWLRRM